MISAPASRLPIADVVKGVFKLLAGDGRAILPTAFARSHLAQAVVRPVHNLAEPITANTLHHAEEADCQTQSPARGHSRSSFGAFLPVLELRLHGASSTPSSETLNDAMRHRLPPRYTRKSAPLFCRFPR